MLKKFLLPAALLALPLSLSAAGAGSQEQEYQQVRKIALRDPKVRAAYEEADRRLEAKMVQIDPTLKPYMKTRQPSGTQATATGAGSPAVAKNRTPGPPHVVAKGETLSSIAAHYSVTVAALKTTNQIQDERKLRAGQTLAIPRVGSH